MSTETQVVSEDSVLGRKVEGSLARVQAIPAPKGLQEVTMTSTEVTAVCPVTYQRDFYTVEIQFHPRDLIIESKSLKLYLAKFSNEGIFAEQLACTICDEILEVVNPMWIEVTTIQSPRGGISIKSQADGWGTSEYSSIVNTQKAVSSIV